MTDTNFQLIADADPEDLPRTLKRERAARAQEAKEREAREAREREAREREKEARSGFARDAAGAMDDDGARYRAEAYLARNPVPVMYGDDPMPATVRRLEVSFVHLTLFFLKAVLAAIPALILLGTILWFGGQALEAQFPELIKMKIMIQFPN